MTAGVAAVGTAWNTALFRELSVETTQAHALSKNSFFFDVLPSSTTVSNFTGWAGLILDLTVSNAAAVTVAQLGRFRSAGNREVHHLAIAKKSAAHCHHGTCPWDGKWVADPIAVNISTCVPDMLGFCYAALSAPVTLEVGSIYYIVSSEAAGKDVFIEMTKSATGAEYGDVLYFYLSSPFFLDLTAATTRPLHVPPQSRDHS